MPMRRPTIDPPRIRLKALPTSALQTPFAGQAPNLGGLARTAEILGASGLVISDARVTGDAAFLGTSVTAERGVPLVEVSEAALVPWLLGRRQEG